MRRLAGPVGWAVGSWSVLAALFHIWTAYAGVWEPREMRAVHLLFLLPLAFLLCPAFEKTSPRDRVTLGDVGWALASLLTTGWVIVHAQELTERWEGVHPVTLTQVIVGTVLVLAVLEATRRAVGFWFFVTTLVFIAYLVLAPWLPGFLRSPRAYSYPRLIEMFFLYADEGVLFFFQAEDGIRDLTVTGVQTCALPISLEARDVARHLHRAHRRQRRPRLELQGGGVSNGTSCRSIRRPPAALPARTRACGGDRKSVV